MTPRDQKPRRFVPPFGVPCKPYAVTVHPADRPQLIGLNRYPRQIIGIALRLPDSKHLNGRVTHNSLSIVWAKPARWWKK